MRFNSLLKYLSFGCICLIIPVMAAATVLEKTHGSEFARDHVYTSLTMIMLWGVISFSAIWYMLRVKLYHKTATFSLHLSLATILIGALTTHLSGKQGKIHLRMGGEPVIEYSSSQDAVYPLPFEVSLQEFRLEYYPGTYSPSDFISDIRIREDDFDYTASVSMNKICSYRNYRFYQSGYDADGEGSILSVSFDPYGIAVTYTGYVWLLLSIILFFFQKRTLFKGVLGQTDFRNRLMIFFLLFGTLQSSAKSPTLPESAAEDFGNLYIYYNDRISPLYTFANDFVKKIYGKDSYQGLSPEQIVTGWLFFYDEWKHEPFIKIKGEEVKKTLGLEGSYACLTDFIGPEGFKLDNMLKETNPGSNNVFTANEKFNLISALVAGAALQIYPFKDKETGNLKWFAIKDKPTEDMPVEQWLFIRNSMDLVAEKVVMKDWDGVSQLLVKIKKYQMNEGGH